MSQKIPLSAVVCALFLSSCTVNYLAPFGYEIEHYPASWEPLVETKNESCPDITGRYYSSYGLLKIIEQMADGSTIAANNPDTIEFTQQSKGILKINGYKGSDLLFSKDVEFGCKSGFVSITLNTEVAVGLYATGYETESVQFGKTRSHQLVAELSTQAFAMVALIIPVVMGENQWLKFQPVETEYVADTEAMFVLGQESLVASRQQFIWFCRAAHKDHAVARFLLASRFYEQAETETSSSRKLAYLWYGLAARSGDDDASIRVEKLTRRMRPGEIDDADSLLNDWKSEPSDCENEAARLQLS